MLERAPGLSILLGPPSQGTEVRRFGAAVLDHPLLASVGVGTVALVLRLLLIPWLPIPQPVVHDEFSYLLAADTFSHGRLTNPTHPLWIHFETFHELSHPTYASKYPPGMGMMLAFGQVMFEQPWAGVLIGFGVLCAVITWAAWVWLPPVWAIVAGILAMLRLTGSSWTEGYMGGTAAAIGGALLVGAFARLRQRTNRKAAIVYGVGLAILANTRPFEGLVLAVVCSAFLIVRYLRCAEARRFIFKRVMVPIACVLVPVFVWMGYYNYRVTGNAWTLPYQAYEAQYSIWSAFLWSNTPRPVPSYHFKVLRDLWAGWDPAVKTYQRQHVVLIHFVDLLSLFRFFLGLPLFIYCVVSFGRILRDSYLRLTCTLLLLFYAGLLVEGKLLPHYFAPGTVLVFVVAAASVRFAADRFPRKVPPAWAAAGLLCCVAVFEFSRLSVPVGRLDVPDREPFREQREMVLKRLDGSPGKQLVIVDYGPQHCVHFEWVYNRADIDGSHVVWARAMGPERDAELLRYFSGRHVWLLRDNAQVTLRPYGGGPVETLPVETSKAAGDYCQ